MACWVLSWVPASSVFWRPSILVYCSYNAFSDTATGKLWDNSHAQNKNVWVCSMWYDRNRHSPASIAYNYEYHRLHSTIRQTSKLLTFVTCYIPVSFLNCIFANDAPWNLLWSQLVNTWKYLTDYLTVKATGNAQEKTTELTCRYFVLLLPFSHKYLVLR